MKGFFIIKDHFLLGGEGDSFIFTIFGDLGLKLLCLQNQIALLLNSMFIELIKGKASVKKLKLPACLIHSSK